MQYQQTYATKTKKKKQNGETLVKTLLLEGNFACGTSCKGCFHFLWPDMNHNTLWKPNMQKQHNAHGCTGCVKADAAE